MYDPTNPCDGIKPNDYGRLAARGSRLRYHPGGNPLGNHLGNRLDCRVAYLVDNQVGNLMANPVGYLHGCRDD